MKKLNDNNGLLIVCRAVWPPRESIKALFPAVAMIGLFLAASGCVTRSYTIETEPSEAEVYVSGEYLGTSPVTRPFVYYGAREVVLRKDGYGVKTMPMKVKAPFYQRFPIDFLPEIIYPGRIRDDQKFSYTLEPITVNPSKDVLQRANESRQRLASVPLETSDRQAGKKKRKGHGVFPYPARERHWWHRR